MTQGGTDKKPSRRESVAAKRARILEAALGLLRGGGLEAMTMRMVADGAGISLGNLQYHFKTRAEVLDALAGGFLEDYMAAVRVALGRADESDLEAGLLFLLTQEVDEDCAVVFKELWALSHRDKACRAALESYYGALRQCLAEWLVGMVPGGDENALAAAGLLIPYLEGYCITRPYIAGDPGQMATRLAVLIRADAGSR